MRENMILNNGEAPPLHLPAFRGLIRPDMLSKAYQIECSCANGDDNPW